MCLKESCTYGKGGNVIQRTFPPCPLRVRCLPDAPSSPNILGCVSDEQGIVPQLQDSLQSGSWLVRPHRFLTLRPIHLCRPTTCAAVRGAVRSHTCFSCLSSLLQAGRGPQSLPAFCDQGASEGFRPVTLWTALVWVVDAAPAQNDCILSDGAGFGLSCSWRFTS